MDDWGQLVDAMRDGAVAVDDDGRYTAVNESFLQLTGYERERVIGTELSLVHDTTDVERIERTLERFCDSNGDTSDIFEATIETATGKTVAVEMRLSPLGADEGTIRGAVGVVREITDRDNHTRKLQRYEQQLERYERIVDVMGDGVYSIDAGGRYTMVNEYLLELLGYDREAIVGQQPSLIHTESEIELFESAIETLLNGDSVVETVEMAIETADGGQVPVEVNLTLLPSDDGEFRGTVGVVRDVTDRKRRERELERYERLIEATGDAVYALDTEGRFTFSNGAHQEIVDRDESELLGEHASISLPEESVENGQALIQALLTSDRRCGTYEMDVRRPDGELV